VKIVRHRLDRELKERLKREAKAIESLRHPAVVRLLLQSETEDGYPYLLTEFIEGESLWSKLQRAPLEERELLQLLRPLCEALDEAHQKGIYHRDLTPRNIMIQPDGAPRLLDFGFAALRGSETLTEKGVVSGTPAYMSPEQWQGLINADAQSDLYSLGVISYLCLSGRLPIDAKTPLEWLKWHATEQPPALTEAAHGKPLSTALSGAIMRAIQKHPTQRQASISEFLSQATA
jgi:serine/threonine protein kinase